MMHIKRIVKQILPPPRTAWRPAALWSLLFWAACFAAVALLADMADVILFASPEAFWLLLLAPWLWWMHIAGYVSLPPWRRQLALQSRLWLFGLLVAVLAHPRMVRPSEGLAMIFAVDISDSVTTQAADDALSWIAAGVGDKPERDEVGLVVFGRDAAVELPPRNSFAFEGSVNAQVSSDGTDLGKALSLSAALLPGNRDGRIVLVSDGTATEGSLDPVLADLASQGIAVDVLGVDYRLANEVWVEKLELPRHVKSKETYEAAVVLSALAKGQGTLVLRENGAVIAEEKVAYERGKNRFRLPMRLRGTGFYEYQATIVPAADADYWADNNTAISHLHLKGEGQVLILTNPDGEPLDARFLVQALRESGRQVIMKSTTDAPRGAMSYAPYDAVLLVNTPAESLDVVQQDALHRAVYHLGVGMAMIGGKDSFGPGGWHKTRVAEALPVSMEVKQKKTMPKGALAIILHTCEFAQGNTWGVRVAKAAIKVLNKQDEAGVLVYDYQNGVSWLFPLTPVTEYDMMSKKLAAATIGDMPDFKSTMELGLSGLKASNAAAKHMIIISDGDASPPGPKLLKKFVDNQISITTVTVFPHGNLEPQLMKQIARTTNGRYYYPKKASLLPKIFIKEARTLKKSMIQNVRFVPEQRSPSAVLKGINAVPSLDGYVITSLKETAEPILVHKTEEDDEDPVLATWRFGLGKTAAWTSDLSSNWGRSWVEWDQYRSFVEQMVADISRVNKPSHLYVQARVEGAQGELIIEDHHPDGGLLDFEAEVIDPEGQARAVSVQQIGPGRYVGTFPLQGRGRYQVLVGGSGEGRQEQVVTGLAVPYAPEYLRFQADSITLDRIAKLTGGRLLRGDEDGKEIFGVERQTKRQSDPVLDWFLICVACLLLADVAFRRIQIDWLLITGWWRKDQAPPPSTETMGALLARKQAVVQDRQDELQRSVPTSAAAAAPADAGPTDQGKQSKGKAKAKDVPPSSDTMQRLLARKRQVEEEREDNT